MPNAILKTVCYTGFALLAFAGNSVLCRLALGSDSIDPSSFTIIRLLSGIITLGILLILTYRPEKSTSKGSWQSAIMLFAYALTFSFAYISLDTGTGALILFGAVQITMILLSLRAGNRLSFSEWAGVIVAFCGFVYLVMPGLNAPSLTGFILMSISGIAWGIYTLNGRGSRQPTNDTAYNFLRTLPLVLILVILVFRDISMSMEGVLLASVSGALTSGIGYAIWYRALPGLSPIQAAVVQLLVPVIAAIGGVVFADEALSTRLILASVLILGGISTVILSQHYFKRTVSETN